jgi:hypothetical protein
MLKNVTIFDLCVHVSCFVSVYIYIYHVPQIIIKQICLPSGKNLLVVNFE